MDDDVAQMFHAVNERFKRLEASLKSEVGEREDLGGRFTTTDSQVDMIVKALGAWVKGNISNKIDDLDKGIADLKKRMDALEKHKK
jgi:hypothetical protein